MREQLRAVKHHYIFKNQINHYIKKNQINHYIKKNQINHYINFNCFLHAVMFLLSEALTLERVRRGTLSPNPFLCALYMNTIVLIRFNQVLAYI